MLMAKSDADVIKFDSDSRHLVSLGGDYLQLVYRHHVTLLYKSSSVFNAKKSF